MERTTLVRRHSRKAKSISALPPHPELDPTHRRSGIRHFTHVPSFRKSTKAPVQQRPRKFSNFGKFKRRAVSEFSGPLEFRSLVNKGNLDAMKSSDDFDGFDGCEEIARETAKEERALKDLTSLQWNRDRTQVIGRPAAGAGRLILPNETEEGEYDRFGEESEFSRSLPPFRYPYPQHIPPAAAALPAQTVMNRPCHPPTPPPCQRSITYPMATPLPKHSHVPKINGEQILNILTGMGLSILALFMWIFRTEVVKYGTVIAIAMLSWKLNQWYTRVTLENRERELVQQGRLLPKQPAQPAQTTLPGHGLPRAEYLGGTRQVPGAGYMRGAEYMPGRW